MWNNDELEYSVNDDGDRIIKMSIGSNMLPHITVDTYQMWTTDSHEEMELDYLIMEKGYDLEGGWGTDYDVTYDHAKILEGLAESCVNAMNDQDYGDMPFTVGEVTSAYSPSAYNFETDSFTADYELNVNRLIHWARNREEWQGMKLEDAIDAYLRERYTSYDGFISYVTGALEDNSYRGERTATLVWGLLHAWMEFEFDRDAWLMGMYDGLTELYMDTVTFQLTDDGWEKNKTQVVRHRDEWLVPDDAKDEYEALCIEADKYTQAETLPGMGGAL